MSSVYRIGAPTAGSADDYAGALVAGEFVHDRDIDSLVYQLGGDTVDLAKHLRRNTDGAARRKYEDRAEDRFDIRDMDGIDLTLNHDNASVFQRAVNHAVDNGVALRLPVFPKQQGILLGSPITVTGPLTIRGDGCGVGRQTYGTTLGPATRLHFAHSGKGIVINPGGPVVDGTNTFDGLLFENLLTTRDHPPYAPGWTPNDHDFDFYCYGVTSIDFRHCLLLNPTRGIWQGGPGSGRLNCDDVRMNPYVCGIEVYDSADVPRFDWMHFWAYAGITYPNTYDTDFAIEHCDALYLRRVDSPMISNFFAIKVRSGIRMGKNPDNNLPPTKVRGVNIDIDNSKYGLWIDPDCNNGSAVFVNYNSHVAPISGPYSHPNLIGNNVRIDGKGCFIDFVNTTFGGAKGSSVNITDSAVGGNNITFAGRCWFVNWGQGGGSQPAINVAANNTVLFGLSPRAIFAPGNAPAGPVYGGAGYISTPDWRPFTPSVAPSSGSFGSAPTVSGLFRSYNGVTTVRFDAAFGTRGTASGAIRLSTPPGYGVPTFGHGVGRGIAVDPAPVACLASPVSQTVEITRTDGFPDTLVADGVRIVGTVDYPA